MNRRNFFAFLGCGAASAVASKSLLPMCPQQYPFLELSKMQQCLLLQRAPIAWNILLDKMGLPDPKIELNASFEKVEKEMSNLRYVAKTSTST